jgi:hypothetical protein
MLGGSDVEDDSCDSQEQEQQQQQQQPAAPVVDAPQAIHNGWNKMWNTFEAVLQGLSRVTLLPFYTAQVEKAQQLRETAGSAHQQRQADEQLLAAQRAEQSLRQPECLLVFIRPDGKVRT